MSSLDTREERPRVRRTRWSKDERTEEAHNVKEKTSDLPELNEEEYDEQWEHEWEDIANFENRHSHQNQKPFYNHVRGGRGLGRIRRGHANINKFTYKNRHEHERVTNQSSRSRGETAYDPEEDENMDLPAGVEMKNLKVKIQDGKRFAEPEEGFNVGYTDKTRGHYSFRGRYTRGRVGRGYSRGSRGGWNPRGVKQWQPTEEDVLDCREVLNRRKRLHPPDASECDLREKLQRRENDPGGDLRDILDSKDSDSMELRDIIEPPPDINLLDEYRAESSPEYVRREAIENHSRSVSPERDMFKADIEHYERNMDDSGRATHFKIKNMELDRRSEENWPHSFSVERESLRHEIPGHGDEMDQRDDPNSRISEEEARRSPSGPDDGNWNSFAPMRWRNKTDWCPGNNRNRQFSPGHGRGRKRSRDGSVGSRVQLRQQDQQWETGGSKTSETEQEREDELMRARAAKFGREMFGGIRGRDLSRDRIEDDDRLRTLNQNIGRGSPPRQWSRDRSPSIRHWSRERSQSMDSKIGRNSRGGRDQLSPEGMPPWGVDRSFLIETGRSQSRDRLRSLSRNRLRSLSRENVRSPLNRSPLRDRIRTSPRDHIRSPPGDLVRSPPRDHIRGMVRDRSRSSPRGLLRSPPRGLLRSPPRGLIRSPARGLFRSPPREHLRSPSEERARSSSRERLRSPPRERVRSPQRHRIRSPLREHVRSPADQDRSPLERMRSPAREHIRSPPRERIRSPHKDRIRSPPRERVRTPLRERARSPPRERARSPVRERLRSPPRERVRSPPRDRVRSPPRERVRSPLREHIRSPPRERLRTPPRERGRSPPRERVRSPPRGRIRSPIRDRMRSPARDQHRSPPRDQIVGVGLERNRSGVQERISRDQEKGRAQDQPRNINMGKNKSRENVKDKSPEQNRRSQDKSRDNIQVPSQVFGREATHITERDKTRKRNNEVNIGKERGRERMRSPNRPDSREKLASQAHSSNAFFKKEDRSLKFIKKDDQNISQEWEKIRDFQERRNCEAVSGLPFLEESRKKYEMCRDEQSKHRGPREPKLPFLDDKNSPPSIRDPGRSWLSQTSQQTDHSRSPWGSPPKRERDRRLQGGTRDDSNPHKPGSNPVSHSISNPQAAPNGNVGECWQRRSYTPGADTHWDKPRSDFDPGRPAFSKSLQSPNEVVFVRGLARDVTDLDIRKDISDCRLWPKDVRVVMDADTGLSRGLAFITFNSVDEATRWMELRNGVLNLRHNNHAPMDYSNPTSRDWECVRCHTMNFRHRTACHICNRIKEDCLDGWEEASPYPTNAIMLRGLSSSTSNGEVIRALKGRLEGSSGRLDAVQMGKDANGRGRPLCFVQLTSVVDSIALYKSLSTEPFFVDGQHAIVSYCQLDKLPPIMEPCGPNTNQPAHARLAANLPPNLTAGLLNLPPNPTSSNIPLVNRTPVPSALKGLGVSTQAIRSMLEGNYTEKDIPILAQYCAAAYAKTPQERVAYINYYTKHYKDRLIKSVASKMMKLS